MNESPVATTGILNEISQQLPADYQVVEFLGEGGHGIVLKAINLRLQQAVALKIIKPDGSKDEFKQIKRMQTEARVLAKLCHENIVKIFQIGSCKDGTPFLVCEYLEGTTLDQYLRSDSQPSPRRILEIFVPVLGALSFAHEHSLLHRDLKPSNVMLLKDPENGCLAVKLLDFGIAREINAGDNQALTSTIQISGSAPYMSPEQCKGEPLDRRSDLYSVACMLYECLSGAPPFSGETPMLTRYKQIHEQASLPLTDKFAHTASRAAVYKLVLSALSKRKEDRPESAAAFEKALIAAMPQGAKRVQWTTTKAIKQRAMVLILIIVSLSLGALFLWQSERRQRAIKSKREACPAPKKLVPLSVHGRMAEIAGEMEKLQADNSWDSLPEGRKLRQEMHQCIGRLNKHDKPGLFVAWRTIADLEERFKLYEDGQNDWSKALSYCRDASGNYTVEACECYSHLSHIALDSRDLPEAEQLAVRGLSLADEIRKTPRFLNIPNLIRRTGDFQDVYDDLRGQMASIYHERGEFKNEEQSSRQVEKSKSKQGKFGEAAVYLLEEAAALISQNKRQEAFRLLKSGAGNYVQNCSGNEENALKALRLMATSRIAAQFPELKSDLRQQALLLIKKHGLKDLHLLQKNTECQGMKRQLH
jgi:serine/threonine protein kinase